MGKINVLSFAVANLIAAGEVVDRPASVIKELMENAIDAGATRVTVEVRNGGVALMRVTDNGCGMAPDELPIAIRRHATSKISDAADLDGITTLGFRGEALAAIASVSDLRILSKTADAEYGALLQAHGGEGITVTEQGCTVGTSVIVENLFANVPARRKFLKKDVTETLAILANVEKIALSHPEIAFRLIADETVRLETAGDGNLLGTVYALYGRDFAGKMLEIKGSDEGVSVRGFIGRTDNFKSNRNYQNFFVNGRFVKSKTAAAALEQAYTSYMPPEKFPCCVLFVDINPARVDVNVHPAKLEVKFSDEKAVFEAVYYAVRGALEQNSTRPEIRLPEQSKNGFAAPGGRMAQATVPVENEKHEALSKRQLTWNPESQIQPQSRMTSVEFREHFVPGTEKTNDVSQKNTENIAKDPILSQKSEKAEKTVDVSQKKEENERKPETAPIAFPDHRNERKTLLTEPAVLTDDGIRRVDPIPPAVPASGKAPGDGAANPVPDLPPIEEKNEKIEPALPYYRIVGTVFHSYVIVETGEKMLLIDQHAAHERILFEELKAGLHRAKVVSQMLMIPLDIMLTSGEIGVLQQYDSELSQIGFSLTYAKNTVSVTAIPQGIETGDAEGMLQTMAGRLLDNTGSVRLTRDIIFEKALYQAACKAAIKAGRDYAPEHIEWLVAKLMALPDITFCPHGRPVAMEMTKKKIDRQFDRTGF